MSSLYGYRTIFTLTNEDTIEDFWSFVIFRLNIEQSESTYDRFARLHNILCSFQKRISYNKPIYLTLEESASAHVVTIQTEHTECLDTLSTRLRKFNFDFDQSKNLLHYSIQKSIAYTYTDKNSQKQKYYYDFLIEDDLDEMFNILEKMHEKNYETIYKTINLSEISDYRTTFSYYSSHLKHYPELSTINNIVAELSVILSLYSSECELIGNDFRVLLQSFLNNLIHWQEKIFVDGTEHLNFMDESFKADLSQIKVILGLYDEEAEDSLDDIFDF